jgi:hypothetical protein
MVTVAVVMVVITVAAVMTGAGLLGAALPGGTGGDLMDGVRRCYGIAEKHADARLIEASKGAPTHAAAGNCVYPALYEVV